MPVDKSLCEHCVYHNYDSKEGVKKCTTIPSDTTANNSSEYKRMNVSLPSSITHHGNACNQVVSMEVLPLGSKPKIGAITSGTTFDASTHHNVNKRPLSGGASDSQLSSGGAKRVCATDKAVNSNTRPDLLTLALNKSLPNTNKTTTSITSSHLKEVQRGSAISTDRGMHNIHSSSDGDQQQGINNIINHSNTARVPAPSSSVFAIGAEMYKQQLMEKENTLQGKLQSINRNNNNALNGNVPVRAVSSLT
eukprot:gene30433-37646_t